MSKQKPSMGRVVIYNHPNKKDDDHHPIKSPAIVMRAWKSTEEQTEKQVVDLFVISNLKRNALLFPKNIEYGEDSNQWNWPPRV